MISEFSLVSYDVHIHLITDSANFRAVNVKGTTVHFATLASDNNFEGLRGYLENYLVTYTVAVTVHFKQKYFLSTHLKT